MSGVAKASLWLLVPILLFGVFVGGLMTWHHDVQLFGDAQIELVGCTESAEVNCDIVNTSAYSELLGVPIATLAIPFYGVALFLVAMALRGREGARAALVGLGVAAVGYSGFLYYVSKTELQYVCAWCIRLYGVNTALLVLAALAKDKLPGRAVLQPAALTYAALLVLSVGGERAYRSTMSGGVKIADAGVRTKDTTGPAPDRTFTVTTEDNREATFSLDADDAWTGNRDAKVAVVMFGDLECGYCKRSSAELNRLEATYGDRVLFVFKHFPLDPACNPGVKNRKHADACKASFAAVCAQEQGVFWPFHDLAYKNQHQLDEDYLRTYAVQSGADGTKYDACMAGRDTKDKVRHDAEVGASIDIHGTPRIFINGKLYRSGASAEVMAKAIEVALGASEADAASKAAALKQSRDIAAIPADVPATQSVTFDGLSFTIDTFEAAIVDGKAVSARHQVPALRTTWKEAKAACEAAGRRMCTEEEWVSACQNARAKDDNGNGELADDMIEGTAYPYGDYHDAGRCWDGKEDETKFRPVYTGESPGCATPTGLYDMTGNAEEWVGETPEKAVLLGGSYDTSDDHATCYRRNDTFGAGYASHRTGFRCCG